MKEKLLKLRAAIKNLVESKRFKWYQRGVLLISSLVAGYYILDSVPFYSAIGNGNKAFQAGDYTTAEAQFRQALAESNRFGKSDPRHMSALNNLAELERVMGRYDASEKHYRELVQLTESGLKPVKQEIPMSLNGLALVLRDRNKFAEAEKTYKEALERWDKNIMP